MLRIPAALASRVLGAGLLVGVVVPVLSSADPHLEARPGTVASSAATVTYHDASGAPQTPVKAAASVTIRPATAQPSKRSDVPDERASVHEERVQERR